MQTILKHIVGNNQLHAKWLNSLSFMENMGARKISACEHRTMVDIVQLKHAAEEHRHAYYLKKQLAKLTDSTCKHYEDGDLLAPVATRQYLHRLDMSCSRYVKENFEITGVDLRYACYLFVTHAIEVRADALYPEYQEALTTAKSRVNVKSIILEEEGHLEEMIEQLKKFDSDWKAHAHAIATIERKLFQEWIAAIEIELHQ
ncbi:hypothetical protein [Sphingobacterium deserti]|uniref:Uncharacterized protein n=1 Tax=Sphingobacterium deserti TaxID=1229276 RepID=A0A0B8T3Q6_9SPHI|nr:hypothetical protein [Sphingobacterium deserti]KGE15841.1 hypothetical protein DI53_0394 [Sphingobacterium deserti]